MSKLNDGGRRIKPERRGQQEGPAQRLKPGLQGLSVLCVAEENCMDEVLVSKVIEKISQTGTAFLDIIQLADLHLEDGKPLDLPKIRQEAETGFKNMEELNAAFAKIVNPDVG
jgi:hypothetical protein